MEACFLPSDDSYARFRAIVSALPHSILSKVKTIFPIALAASDPYVILKEEVLKVTSPSSSERIKELLSKQSLGDRKPTEFLNHLQRLLGPNHVQMEETFTRPMFFAQMPHTVRAILSAFPRLSLSDSAEAADRILQELPPSDIYAASNRVSVPLSRSPSFLSQPTSFPSSSSVNTHFLCESRLDSLERNMQAVQTELRNLSIQFSTLIASQRSLSARSPSPSFRLRDRSSSRERSYSHTPSGVCFYHNEFKERARKCNPPCSYSGSIASSSSPGN